MKIFIMRHGESEMFAKSDKDRQLTAFGKDSSFKQGTHLKSTALPFDKVLVSPFIRATQTFEQVNNAYEQQLSPIAEIWDAITPYGSAELVYDYLVTLLDDGIENLLIISHLPLVGEIIAEICGKNNVSFLPGTVAEIDWDGGKGKVIRSKNA